MNGLTDIPGIRVGHASDYEAITGCTVILCDGNPHGSGAVGGVAVLGGATGSQELDVLSPGHITERVHAVVLAGGSAFGLEAASGVRNYLEQQGVGFNTGAARVPIVPGAILYDLAIGKAHVRPTREMGIAAAQAANSRAVEERAVEEGSVGAGTGATVGKIFGMKQAMKGGLGSYSVHLGGGVLVSALAVVNAFGDVRDSAGKIIAGARRAPDSKEFADTEGVMKTGSGPAFPAGRANTTLVVVATNAKLAKPATGRLALMAGSGLARTIFPASTTLDGDIVFALSIGDAEASVNALGVAASEAVSQAILRGVRLAKTLGGVPGLGE